MNPVVYYVTCSDRPGEVKIGTSTDVLVRARNLCPIREGHEHVLLAVEPGGRDVERRRHAQFAAMRKGGEWFTFGAPLISHVMELDQAPVVTSVDEYRIPIGV